MLVMGFMSGTSLDGVDVALVETDGETVAGFGPSAMIAYTPQECAAIETATVDALEWNGFGTQPASFIIAAEVIEEAHIRAGRDVMTKAGRVPDLIGFHGQTLLHRPERKLSIQIGDPQVVADALGAPVVAQMRQNDLIEGGQGAPLVPVYHAALAKRLALDGPVAFLNVGGVANLTWIGSDGSLVAFDTGPGNGLIDQLVQERGMGRYDDGGRFAAMGTVDLQVLEGLLSHPHFVGSAPKSLDRYDFPLDWAANYTLDDAAATLTAFTAGAVAKTAGTLPEVPKLWVVCGGGSHNPVMMQGLCDALGDCRTADDLGLRSDFIEAEAMAFLAARCLHGLPITFPGTTGVEHPITGGIIVHPSVYA